MKLGHTIEDSKSKYPELTDEIIDQLRKWLDSYGFTEVPDEQIALFAHSCYYDIEATKRCINVYYKLRATVPEFFANRDPRSEYLQQSLKALEFVSLPIPDDNGNRIIFHRLSDTRPSSYMFNDGIKLLGMSLDASLYTVGCAPGYIFLFDMRGVKLGHLTRLSVSSIRRFFEYLQDGLPVRLKGIHVLNAVWFMDKVLALIKPFMKQELFEILHLYTGNVSEVYEHIPQKCLPVDFGGELETSAKLHEEHCTRLDQLRDYFDEEERLFRGWINCNGKKNVCDSSINETTPEEIKVEDKTESGETNGNT